MNCPRLGTRCVCACILLAPPAIAQLTPSPATQTLLVAKPGLRPVASGDRLTALYGVPIETDADPATSTDAFVTSFLAQHSDALGVVGVTLQLQDKIDIRNGKFSVYTYYQTIEGLPVHGSMVKIPVLLGATEKIGYTGMRLIPLPAGALPQDVLTSNDALAVVQQSADYGHLVNFTPAEKVVFEAEDYSLHRVWRFSGSDNDESYLFFVDTNDGEIVDAFDQIFHGTVSGSVDGFRTPCSSTVDPTCPYCCPVACSDPMVSTCSYCCPVQSVAPSNCCPADNPNNPDSCPVKLPMFGVEVSIEGGPTTYTDDTGYYEFNNLPDGVPVTLSSQLVGRCGQTSGNEICVTVDNFLGGELQPTPASWTGLPGSPGSLDVRFHYFSTGQSDDNCTTSWPAEFETSQINGYVRTQQAHDWFKRLQPSWTGIDQNLVVEVNNVEFSVCIAFYDSSVPRIAFGIASQGAQCTNFASPTIVAHEYGHFAIDQRVPFVFDVLSFFAFHEGAADAFSALSMNTDQLGLDAFADGTALRNIDLPDVRLSDCGSLPNWCGSCGSPHCNGLALGGAFWDLQKELRCCVDENDPEGPCVGVGTCVDDLSCGMGEICTDRLTEELFADFLFVTDGILDRSILVEVLVADDDNADLTDGTPNSQAILDSFVGLHGWCNPLPDAAGDGTVVVEWVGPAPGVDPEVGVDYRVQFYEGCPPDVTLVTTEKGTDPVLRWRIGRVDPQTGNPLDLGTIGTDWSGTPHNIRVEVGSVVDPTRAVNSVERVLIDQQSSTNWSNIILELPGDLVESARCFGAADGTGGRISGNIAGNAPEIRAESVGLEVSQPGSLNVGGHTRFLGLEGSVVAGTMINIAAVDPSFPVFSAFIGGDFNGTLQIADPLAVTLVIVGGNIGIGGNTGGNLGGTIESANIIGQVVIYGDVSSTGAVRADDDIIYLTVLGNVDGTVHADEDGDGEGVIGFGSVSGGDSFFFVTGVINGELCAADLAAGGLLHGSNSLGSQSTICGEPACTLVFDELATGNEDGRSWQDAFTDFSTAEGSNSLRTANSCLAREFRFAEGTYHAADLANPTDPRSATIELRDSDALYGGFPPGGGDGTLAARDVALYETVLTGDIGVPGDNSDNSYHVITASGVFSTIDGVTIAEGNADGTDPFEDEARGGGILVTDSTLVVIGCRIADNSASYFGGGIHVKNSVIVMDSCVLSGNQVSDSGGGMYIDRLSTLQLSRSTFSDNWAAGFGGGMYNEQVNPFMVSIDACAFLGNDTTVHGGGVLTVGNLVLTNCLFSGNTSGSGGGMATVSSTATLVNCTFNENAATFGSGGGFSGSGVIDNSVFWGNTASSGVDPQISAFNTVSYSDVQGGYVGTGNIDADPQFVDADGDDDLAGTEDDNLHIRASSPCIEAGGDLAALPATDFDENPRQHDADLDGTATVDMGAYEYQGTIVESPQGDGSEQGYQKNRYLSFLPTNAGKDTALRVTLAAFDDNGPEDPIGSQWWVGPPVQVCENSGQGLSFTPPNCGAAPGIPQKWFWAAPLICTATPWPSMYRDWTTLTGYCVRGSNHGLPCFDDMDCPNNSTCGASGVVHVYGEAVIPSRWKKSIQTLFPTSYDVQTINENGVVTDETHYSTSLSITMSHWGDIVADASGCPNGPPNGGDVDYLTDVIAVLNKFQNLSCAPIKSRADIVPDLSPNQKVEISDVSRVIDAWQSTAYPFLSSSVTCP